MRFSRIALVLVVTVAGSAALSPGASGAPSAGSAAFKDEADDACAKYQSRLDRLISRAKRAETKKERAAVLNDTADVLDDVNADLKKVTPPPVGSKREARFRALIQAFADVARYYRRGAEAILNGNESRAGREIDKGIAASELGVKLATRLDLPACGAGD